MCHNYSTLSSNPLTGACAKAHTYVHVRPKIGNLSSNLPTFSQSRRRQCELNAHRHRAHIVLNAHAATMLLQLYAFPGTLLLHAFDCTTSTQPLHFYNSMPANQLHYYAAHHHQPLNNTLHRPVNLHRCYSMRPHQPPKNFTQNACRSLAVHLRVTWTCSTLCPYTCRVKSGYNCDSLAARPEHSLH